MCRMKSSPNPIKSHLNLLSEHINSDTVKSQPSYCMLCGSVVTSCSPFDIIDHICYIPHLNAYNISSTVCIDAYLYTFCNYLFTSNIYGKSCIFKQSQILINYNTQVIIIVIISLVSFLFPSFLFFS